MSNLSVVFLSDTHGRHREAELPNGDLLIHGGDVSNGREEQLLDFLEWFEAQPHTYKVFIGGNMDRALEADPAYWRAQLSVHTFYLENELLEIGGLRIWGSPMIPRFVGAFNRRRGAELAAFWEQIPHGLDILLTHTPPHGILDRTSLGLRVGCRDLARKIEEIRPRFHFFGHIHESYGRMESGETMFANGSFVRGRFRKPNPPLVFTL